MKIVNEYIKGGNKGLIAENIYAGETSYIAVTASTSKTYKTLKGAEHYMAIYNYIKVA